MSSLPGKRFAKIIVLIVSISMVWQGIVWADPNLIQPNNLQVRTLINLPDIIKEGVSPLVSSYIVRRLAELERDIAKQHPSRIEGVAKELVEQVEKDADIPEELLKVTASSAKGDLVIVLGSHAVRYYNHKRSDTKDPGHGYTIVEDIEIGEYFSRQVLKILGEEYFSGGAEVNWSEWEIVDPDTLRAKGNEGVIAKRGPNGKFDIMSGGLPVDPVDKELKAHIRALFKSTDWTVRGTAAEALGKMGDKRAVWPLIQTLKDKQEYVRELAAEALGEIGDKRAVQFLMKVLKKDKDKDVREAAMEALGKMGVIVKRDPDGKLRSGLSADEKGAAHIQALKDRDKDARIDKELLTHIRALKDRDKGVRKAAAEALGKIGNKRAVEPLIQAFEDIDWAVREAAVEALYKIGKSAIGLLNRALKDKNELVRLSAAEALGKIGGNKAVRALTRALKDEDMYVRQAAAEAVGILRSKAAPATEYFISDGTKIEWSKWKIVDCDTLLRNKYDEDDEDVVAKRGPDGKFSEIYSGLPIDEEVQRLIRLFEDVDPDIRKGVAKNLGEIGDNEAVKPLIRVLEDKEEEVRSRSNSLRQNR